MEMARKPINPAGGGRLRRSQRGIAVIAALFVALLVTAAALGGPAGPVQALIPPTPGGPGTPSPGGPQGGYAVTPTTILAGSGDTILTLGFTAGAPGFADGTVAQWNGIDLVTTHPANLASALMAIVPQALLAQSGVGNVTAVGGGTTIAIGPVFVTAADTTALTAIGTSAPSGPATASVGGPSGTPGSLSVAASGGGMVALAEYASDPVATPNPGGGSYFDVYVAPNSTFTTLTLVVCNGGQALSWWDGTAWNPVDATNQTLDSPPGCITATLDGTTAPSVTQLSGTPFVRGPVTTAYVCALTERFIERSTKFKALSSRDQAAAKQRGAALCQHLASARQTLSPTEKARLIADYQAAVQAAVPPGWLTQDQANTLIRLSRAV